MYNGGEIYMLSKLLIIAWLGCLPDQHDVVYMFWLFWMVEWMWLDDDCWGWSLFVWG